MPENTPPFTAAEWNRFLGQKKLMASRCTRCGAVHLPPRAVCPDCHADQMEWTELGGKGRLAAFTSVYVAPTWMVNQGFGRDHPYLSGVVELDEGVKISARILDLDAQDPASIRIGTPLTVEFLEAGEPGKVTLAFKP